MASTLRIRPAIIEAKRVQVEDIRLARLIFEDGEGNRLTIELEEDQVENLIDLLEEVLEKLRR